MAEILSQEEIDALLKNVDTVKPEKRAGAGFAASFYDFKHPSHITSEQLREIEAIHQNFSRDLSIKLSSAFHDTVAVSVNDIINQTYGEYLSGIFSPTCFYSFSGEPIDGLSAIEVAMDAAFPMIDKMLGGTGEQIEEKRELTGIEYIIMDDIMEIICYNISASWSRILRFSARIKQKGFSPDIIFVADSNEMVLTIPFEIVIGSTKGTFSISYSSIFLKPIIDAINAKKINVLKEQLEFRKKLMSGIKEVVLNIACDLPAERMNVKELLSIKVNDILKTSFRPSDTANISVNDIYKMFGNVMSEDDKRGVKVVKISTAEETN